MFRKIMTRQFIGLCILAAAITGCATPLAPGGTTSGGPVGGVGAVLLDQTSNCTIEADGFCRVRLGFNPTQAGRTIAIDVTASLTQSRPAYTVADVNNNVVSNVPNPLTNMSSSSFTANSTSQHAIVITELINPASTYRVQVRQN